MASQMRQFRPLAGAPGPRVASDKKGGVGVAGVYQPLDPCRATGLFQLVRGDPWSDEALNELERYVSELCRRITNQDQLLGLLRSDGTRLRQEIQGLQSDLQSARQIQRYHRGSDLSDASASASDVESPSDDSDAMI